MNETEEPTSGVLPYQDRVNIVTIDDTFQWLGAGWRDFKAGGRVSLAYGMIFVVAGIICLLVPFMLGLCRNTSGGTISCTDPFYRQVFEFGFGVVLMSIFTGVPALLALAGLVFAALDLTRYFRRRLSVNNQQDVT